MRHLLLAGTAGARGFAEAHLRDVLASTRRLQKRDGLDLYTDRRTVLVEIQRRLRVGLVPGGEQLLVQLRRVLRGNQLIVGLRSSVEVTLARDDVTVQEMPRDRLLEVRRALVRRDDINDAGAMKIAGMSASPANAQPAIRDTVSFVSTRDGGNGAVRELIEAILASRPSSL